ncbi:MAG: TetR/AcrR family transcriptional regulator [Acidimicrobiia bacterium]|nr:TetR/AcrR family transcriptional regulator [Acidimicrobiia bacterium]
MNAGAAYHHGDLPAALRAATVELVAERGPVGFSLREVARRAGVSHAAPAHHFGDSKGLLTAVAIEGFQDLCRAFESAVAGTDDPVDRMTAMGKAYVGVAVNQIGHFAVMWTDELVDTTNPELVEASARAYGYLESIVTAIAEEHNPELDVDAASILTWSAVHGLAMLHCKTGTGEEPARSVGYDLDLRVQQFTDLLMAGFAKR